MRREAVSIVAAALLATAWLPGAPAQAQTAKKGARATQTDPVLVRIGNEVITRSDVQRRLDDMPEPARASASTPEGRQQLLERMVEERVWLMAALKNGVAERPRLKSQLEDQRRNLIIRTWVQEVMAANPAPSDSEAKAYYEAHRSEYRIPANVTIRHIQTKNQADARKVIGSLRAGGDFTRLAKTWSVDTLTRNNGGLLGAVTQEGQFSVIGREPALAESAFTLKTGRVGGPWKSARGWHVMKADEVNEETLRPFEQVRPMIVRQMSSERSRAFYNSKLDSVRRALGVRPDSNAIKKFTSQKKSAREMFQEAQARGPAVERIAAYEALLRDHPDSDVAPQAQFMIGFIYSEELKNYEEAEKAFRAVLSRYPKSELAASAQWMVDHMRSEEAPPFSPLEADTSARSPAPKSANRNSSAKP